MNVQQYPVVPVIYDALLNATSQDICVLNESDRQLKEWETQPGFYTTLMNIVLNKDLNINVRWLATVYFKNGVDKYWRRNAPNGISEEEKTHLRSCLLNVFDEPVDQIASQIAVLISKIARIDYPKDWPDLLNVLVFNIKCESSTIRLRALLCFHHSLKVLSTKKIIVDRKVFMDVACNTFPHMLQYWYEHMSAMQTAISNGAPAETMKMVFSVSIISTKIVSILMKRGYTKPEQCPLIIDFIKLIFEHIKTLINHRKLLLNTNPECTESCDKLTKKLVKTVLRLLEDDPLSYVDFISETLSMSYYYCFTDEGYSLIFPELLPDIMNMMKLIIICQEYGKSSNFEFAEFPNLELHDDDKAWRRKKEFFTESIISTIIEKLVGQYFLLTEKELKEWNDDPETYVCDEVGRDNWRFCLRACAESLFVALMCEYRESITPFVIRIVENGKTRVHSTDLQAILRKDAIYNCFGLVYYDLFETVNFDDWFSEILLPELNDKSPYVRIIRRRALSVTTRWLSLLSPNLRKIFYAELLQLLDSNEDLVVRLTACASVKQVVDDLDFKDEIFAENGSNYYFHSLFALLRDVSECETKMKVIDVLSFIIEHTERSLLPHINDFITFLPALWDESSDHNMLRVSVIYTVIQIIKCLGKECYKISKFVKCLVSYSVLKDSPGSVYLLEDGLLLLEDYITQLESYTDDPEIFDLFIYVLPHLEYPGETFNTSTSIGKNYFMLCPDKFLHMYGSKFIDVCHDVSADLKNEYVVALLLTYELFLKVKPMETIPLLQHPLQRVITDLCSSNLSNPSSIRIAIISRVILNNPESFSQLILAVSDKNNVSFNDVFSNLLDCYLNKLSTIFVPPREKLVALALSSLLAFNSDVVLNRFDKIMTGIVEKINDIVETDSNPGIFTDFTYSKSEDINNDLDDSDDEEDTCAAKKRKKQTEENDFIYKIDVLQVFRSKLEILKKQLGAQNFGELMKTISEETLDSLRLHTYLADVLNT